MIAQARLVSGVTTLTCWIESDRISEGSVISLKKDEVPDRRWVIEKLGQQIQVSEVRNLGYRHQEVRGGLR